MTRKKGFFIAFVLLLIVTIALFLFFKNHHNSHELVLYGNVDVRQVEISFRVPGQVEELFFQEGDLVTPGAPLARLNSSPFTSQVKEAQAMVASLIAQKANADILLKRRHALIGDEAISQEDLDNAATSVQIITQQLLSAQATLTIAEENLSYTQVYAPNEGIVLSRIREPGSVVSATEAVYTLSLTSPIWIRAYVSEPNLGKIAFGMKATISTDTEGAPTYVGRVGFISPVAEFTPKTVQTTDLRTDLVYRIRIYVDEPDSHLKQGMPITATFNLEAP